MRNKLDDVVEFLFEHDLDMFCITETWLLESDTDVVKAALPRSFTMLQIPRPDDGRGGGVAIIYKRGLSSVKLVQGDHFASFEYMEVVVHHASQVTRMGIVYRPGHPGTDREFLSEFDLFLDTFLTKNGRLLICGDFNYWVDNPSGKPYSVEFVNMLNTNNLVNSVAGPTHVSGHTLDLVLSFGGSDCVREVNTLPVDLRLSDHSLVLFSLVHPKISSLRKTIKFRNYSNVDKAMVARGVGSELDGLSTAGFSSAEMVEAYSTLLRNTEDRYCPVITKTIIVRDGFPWYDASVSSLRCERRRAERRWRRVRTDELRDAYVEARRVVVARTSARKVEYYRNLVGSSGGDQKKLYSVLNNLMGRKNVSPLPNYACEARLAAEFAVFFQLKIERIRRALDDAPAGEFSVNLVSHFDVTVPLRQFQPVDAVKVLGYIQSCRKTHCPLDPFDASRLPEALETSSGFIAKIINQGFLDECFASSEKVALLRPLLKKKDLDSQDMNNYRPVSNLSLLSKIMERAVLDQLLPVLMANGVIPSLQSAYRQFHSTETALCKIHNDLVLNTCAGRSSVLVMLDLSAAFDTVDHLMLLSDLEAFGMGDSALSFMRSYLSGRVQRVVVGGATSEPVPLECGVPQGSVLGPILFSVYISSLVAVLEAHGVAYHFYADDTQFYIQIEDVADAVEKVRMVLVDVKLWMSGRKLKLNDGKTEIMVVKGNSRRVDAMDFGDLQVDGALLRPVGVLRNLGFRLDTSLDFGDQINSVVRVCQYHIRNLYAVRKFLDHQSLVTLVHSLVLSHVDYCNVLYIGLPVYLLRKLQSILNRAARLIFFLPPRTPTTRPSLDCTGSL